MRKLTCVRPISSGVQVSFGQEMVRQYRPQRETGHPWGRGYKLQTGDGRGKQQIHERELPLRPPSRRGSGRRDYSLLVSFDKTVFCLLCALERPYALHKTAIMMKMARGWESKSVEAQQAEASEKSSTPRSRLSPEQAANRRHREVPRVCHVSGSPSNWRPFKIPTIARCWKTLWPNWI